MDNVLYWIWLTTRKYIGPKKITILLDRYKTVENIYKETSFREVRGIGTREIASLKNKNLDYAKDIEKRTREMGGDIITYDSEKYPVKLKNITPPPYILYVKGDIIDIDNVLSVAVVGTRKCSDYGKVTTHRISQELATRGALIISGMAEGIDTFSLIAALRAGAKCVAVIGSGLDVVYPKQNARLMEAIANNGMVITEYPIGTPAYPGNFPERNRIIAGLANAVLVAEAPQRSGSLITARQAMEFGRDVFAVPGQVGDINYAGSNKLIQQGAKLTNTANDIIEEYPYIKLTSITPAKEEKTEEHKKVEEKTEKLLKCHNLKEDEVKIVKLLDGGEEHIDEIARKLDMSIRELNGTLTMLEMKLIIKKLPGGIYKICD